MSAETWGGLIVVALGIFSIIGMLASAWWLGCLVGGWLA